ncbi:MAG: hypothetical protein HQM16_01550 [Deltaproteobacteria bacterium]|nr:hypothetical protein [Deltaproteobacteria bacterium]
MTNNNDILKGNYQVPKKAQVNQSEINRNNKDPKEDFKQKVLSSLGGSMVYMDRDKLIWDGDKK